MENLKEWRIQNGLSRAKLAEMLGVNKLSILNWETGAFQPEAETKHRLEQLMQSYKKEEYPNGEAFKIMREAAGLSRQVVCSYLPFGDMWLYHIEEGENASEENKKLLYDFYKSIKNSKIEFFVTVTSLVNKYGSDVLSKKINVQKHVIQKWMRGERYPMKPIRDAVMELYRKGIDDE